MKKKKIITLIAIILLILVLSFTLYVTLIIAGNYVIDPKKMIMDSSTTIVDQNGETVTKLYVENRDLISITEIPDHVQHAFIAIEDARFFQHRGIDYRAIGRALYRDIIAGSMVEGGSTITQQLVKNTFLTNEKTILRKTKEVLIAVNLERKYSKEEILEMYLNRIYFGHGVYGIQAASTLFFNKNVSELSVDEAALLAGLPKAPNTYSPLNHPELSIQRRNLVLSVMEQRGYLSAEEVVSLQRKSLKMDPNRALQDSSYFTYIDMVLEEAENLYDLSNEEILRGGYTIVVTIDKELQAKSYEMLQEAEAFQTSGPEQEIEAAFVLMDNKSGGILAAHGGRNYVRQGLNRVNVKRQPGSTIKPLVVYAPALETGQYHPYSLLKDELLDYDGYTPRNFNNQYQGLITMYDAIKDSANAPAVWLLNELSVDEGKRYLNDLAITVEEDYLPIALGGLTEGITPLDLVKAYRPFAAEGKAVDPYIIERIYNKSEDIVAEVSSRETQVISPQTAWYMTRMLEAAVTDGTAQSGDTIHPLAGKTGTTSYTNSPGAVRDAWFVGYTPEVVGTVWIGYDRTDDNHHLTFGSSEATKLFKQIIDRIPKTTAYFEKPYAVTELEEPIRLEKVTDLQTDMSLNPFTFGLKLSWTAQDDTRVIYQIFEVDKGEYRIIDQVVGKGEYLVRGLHLFSKNEYVVIPYNPQTGMQGEQSNKASVP
ncbi:MAG: PBP1A family penicillin-binding protein [Bacillaceae bacterium]|nr:PBP1A family penicillin-binding protein [Bacillaceae bacterium]